MLPFLVHVRVTSSTTPPLRISGARQKMVRFVHFIVALVALGVTVGDPVPSSKGELSLERKGDLETYLNRQVYDSRVSATNDSS